MNEWYYRDMSQKMRTTLKLKNSKVCVIGHPPCGYKYDGSDKKFWAIDEETADAVSHTFNLRKQGESMNGIAKILKREKFYISSVYAIKKALKNHCVSHRLENIYGLM